MGGGGGGIPSDYLVSTQLQLWLFCCWAVTIKFGFKPLNNYIGLCPVWCAQGKHCRPSLIQEREIEL